MKPFKEFILESNNESLDQFRRGDLIMLNTHVSKRTPSQQHSTRDETIFDLRNKIVSFYEKESGKRFEDIMPPQEFSIYVDNSFYGQYLGKIFYLEKMFINWVETRKLNQDTKNIDSKDMESISKILDI